MNVRNIKLAYQAIQGEFMGDPDLYYKIRNTVMKDIQDDQGAHEINIYEAFLYGMAYERVGEDE